MSSVAVYDTVKNYLIAMFPALQVIDFDTLDNALEQSLNQFLCLQEGYTVEEMVGIGDPNNVCIREISGLVIHCFTPAPESSGQARILGEQVQDFVRFQNFTPNMRVLDTSPPEVELMNDGLWTSASVPLTVANDRHVAIP